MPRSSSGVGEVELGAGGIDGCISSRGLLGISSDGNHRRIFLGLKFSVPGFFWVRKFGKYFLG